MAWRQACRSAQSPGSTLPSPGRHVCAQSAPIRCSVHHGSGLSMPNRACHGIRKSPNAHQQQPQSTQTAKSRIPQHAQHPKHHGTPPHHGTIPTITHATTYTTGRTQGTERKGQNDSSVNLGTHDRLSPDTYLTHTLTNNPNASQRRQKVGLLLPPTLRGQSTSVEGWVWCVMPDSLRCRTHILSFNPKNLVRPARRSAGSSPRCLKRRQPDDHCWPPGCPVMR